MPPLHHGLFTNASGGRGRGFRHLFVAPAWSAADRQRLGRWLETLRPPSGAADDGAERVAVNSFRVGATIHACLARVDARFARDEHGRAGGVLVHGLFLPLAEGRPVGHYGAALLAASRRFARPETHDTDRLEVYLEQCRACREIAVSPVDAEIFRGLDEDFLARFYTFSSSASRGREVVFSPLARPLADALAAAAAGLPPRLRLACRWAVGLRPTADMSFAARAADASRRLPPLPPGAGGAFARQVARRDTVSWVENWDIRSWDVLAQSLGSP